ncbi:MAG TPA: hypothetical protein VI815_02265 [Candidatus Nanoarchaeia archaeon]|nr:hypothetical protein [Candidatus Nanoarchaeia archaeon]
MARIIIEQDDKTVITLEGYEASKWMSNNLLMASNAQKHGCNPFENDPIKWNTYLPTNPENSYIRNRINEIFE